METILFDLSVCQPNGSSKFHGGGIYGYILFKELAKTEKVKLIAYFDFNKFIPDEIYDYIDRYNIEKVNSSIVSLGETYIQHNVSLFYSPLFNTDYFELAHINANILFTLHGLRALEMNRDKFESKYATSIKQKVKILIKHLFYSSVKKRYYNNYWRILSMPNTRFITISDHSKASLLYYYPELKSDNIKVFPSPNHSIDVSEIAMSSHEKYYLMVSGDRWLKNSYRVLCAFDNLISNNPEFKGKLYITGIDDTHPILSNIINKDRIKIFGYVSREELEELYRNAYVLIFLSLNEGFGEPPIEAMKYQVPVIASALSAISEICGDSVLYCNPYSLDEIGIRLIELDNPEIYKEYRNRGIERYKYIKDKQDIGLHKLVTYIIELAENNAK